MHYCSIYNTSFHFIIVGKDDAINVKKLKQLVQNNSIVKCSRRYFNKYFLSKWKKNKDKFMLVIENNERCKTITFYYEL